MYRRVLNRRTLLRGTGALAVGLPFLDEMRSTSVYASAPEPPVRAFNLFFGLGLPKPILDEGWRNTQGWISPLEPLLEFQNKLSVLRGVNHVTADVADNAHHDGASAAFTGLGPKSGSVSGGGSIDQALRRSAYPDGLPAGMVATLISGVYFRRSRPNRYIHNYNPDGSVAEAMNEKPTDTFKRVFGEAPGGEMPAPSAADERARRLRTSVLDSLDDQYKFFNGDRSGLGKASRARISDHLDRIRELEQRVNAAGTPGVGCTTPELPEDAAIPRGGNADPGGNGVDVTVEQLSADWQLHSELTALAVHCDRVRFAGLTFLSAGERMRLSGNYTFDGQSLYDFDDKKQFNGTGKKATSHEYWHGFKDGGENGPMRAHLHFKMSQMAYFLRLLDDQNQLEENGRSVLENSLTVVTTESGDGRHSDAKRELSGVFHAISGGNERFKTGEMLDLNAHGLDLYNTLLDAYQAPALAPMIDGPAGQVLA